MRFKSFDTVVFRVTLYGMTSDEENTLIILVSLDLPSRSVMVESETSSCRYISYCSPNEAGSVKSWGGDFSL